MSDKVRVLIATGTMNAGGAESLIMEILRHSSNEVEYIVLIHHTGPITPGVYDDEIRKIGVPIVFIPSVGSIGENKYIEIFKERISEIGRVDIIHSHLNAVGGIIAKAAKIAGIKHRIIHCHADITYRGNRISKLLNETKLQIMRILVNRYGTSFWACSEPAARRLFYGNKTFKIIPNVIDVEKYLPDVEKEKKAKERLFLSGRTILGAVGRIAPIKNYEFIIKVLYGLKQQNRLVDFVCYGRIVDETYYKRVLKLATEYDVIQQVHFLGNSIIIQDDIAAFDVFLMPSHSEGFGIAAIEAQAAGLPTIVSTGVPQIVDVGLGIVKFLPLEEEKWVEEIIKSLNMQKPENDKILNAFNIHNLNSVNTVREIEKEYLRIASC